MRSAGWNVFAGKKFLQHLSMLEKNGRTHRNERDLFATREVEWGSGAGGYWWAV
jgi:hypothetical protein